MPATGIFPQKKSCIYSTAPVPASDQPDYKNAVITATTELPPDKLLKTLKNIEKKFGRHNSARNASRPLDLDIIDYNKQVVQINTLFIPHSRMAERSFVLFPLKDIDRGYIHPQTGQNMDQMIENLPDSQKISKETSESW